MVKPRTAPHSGKPHTAPEYQHAVMSQKEQSEFLGRGDEVVSNLGHPSREDDLTRHPLGKVDDYANSRASESVVDGPARGQGVYRKFANPQSGISTNQQNLDRWTGYARSNSYHGGHGEGVEPKMPDPRERAAGGYRPSERKDSDGYLADPKDWPSYEYGSEAGLGRLEKSQKY
jgi:hypothetical protein